MGSMKNHWLPNLILFSFLLINACQRSPLATVVNTQEVTDISNPTIAATATFIPTETPVPLPAVAIVNGERILQSDFDEEFQRYQDAATAVGNTVDLEIGKATVLENLIDLDLLAQAAREGGFELTDEMVQQRLEALISTLGSEEKLQTWLTTNHYNRESFERSYRIEIEAAHMREQIIAEVPTTAEQIHARQIMVQSKQLATNIYNQLQAGADFATLSWIYDPITGGELSWFPRNYLVIPEIEEAVFALQPGEYTEIIATDYGYQIVQVVEKEMARPLTEDALLAFQRSALANWVQMAKSNAQIEILSQ